MMAQYAQGVLVNAGLLGFLALSAYILMLAGEMSFGQQAFFGIGAYAAGMLTALAGLPLVPALLIGAAGGGVAAGLLGLLTLRLRGLYFSMATLALAETLRIVLELFSWRIPGADGQPGGPQGSAGFGGIRSVFESGLGQGGFVLLVYALLLTVLLILYGLDRIRIGTELRMVGEDPALAALYGIDVYRVKLCAAAGAGAVAALGGGLFAHYNTFIEPVNFDVMLGVHSLCYALIGGLGTPLGPLLGVAIDIVLLEGSRLFQGYRMIAFGALVALFLILRPRGLLDERSVNLLRRVGRGRK
ncbi:branched-chain amino acid ABC transporter permease [Oxalobacteraceae bacterium]|nr:branched-chain amino acid ABC transporter permease [Oxalobacteraceae bacterium]